MKEINKKNDKLSIANWIALLGLVSLCLFTFSGAMYLNGGEIGKSILTALLITAAAAALSALMIKAKSQENEFLLWKIVEGGSLALYVALFIFSSTYMIHFFVVNEQNELLKQTASQDIEHIKNLFTDYENFEKNAIKSTESSLESCKGVINLSTELKSFTESHSIDLSTGTSSIYNYCETTMTDKLLGDSYNRYKSDIDKQMSQLKGVIESWNILKVSQAAKGIESIASAVTDYVNKLTSENANLLPIAGRQNSEMTIIIDSQSRTFEVPQINFKSSLMKTAGSSALAWVLFSLVNVLILLNYIVTNRSHKVKIGKNGSAINQGRPI